MTRLGSLVLFSAFLLASASQASPVVCTITLDSPVLDRGKMLSVCHGHVRCNDRYYGVDLDGDESFSEMAGEGAAPCASLRARLVGELIGLGFVEATDGTYRFTP